MKLWPMLNRLPVLPPPNRLGNRGRPSNYARRKSANESSSSSSKTKLSREKRVMTCSNCREEGHTKPRCSKPSVQPEPKRPRGRPKNDQVPFYCLSDFISISILENLKFLCFLLGRSTRWITNWFTRLMVV